MFWLRKILFKIIELKVLYSRATQALIQLLINPTANHIIVFVIMSVSMIFQW